MAVEEFKIIQLRNDFYKDGFYKILFAMILILIAIGFLIALSTYLFFSQPKPISFSVDNDWRVVRPVPITEPFLSTPDLIQWVSNVIPGAFTFDFVNYSTELKKQQEYFTDNGWQVYQGHVNTYANADTVQNSKLFVYGNLTGAPFILNQGVLQGTYAWWVQIPLTINYSGGSTQALTIQALIVRIPTENNLYGVAIDNMIITQGKGNQVSATGQ